MAIAWVLFPLVMLAVCLGCGLLVERASGWLLPGALLPTVGLALVIVAVTFTTSREFSAPWSTPVVVVLALAGYALSWARLRGLRLRVYHLWRGRPAAPDHPDCPARYHASALSVVAKRLVMAFSFVRRSGRAVPTIVTLAAPATVCSS